jgi:serine/threonine-protein kinase HipA
MPSERQDDETYVWIWLPNQTDPVIAGLLSRSGKEFVFNYGQSYLRRPDAIAIYHPELPLKAGRLPLLPGLIMPNCIRDASPDAWGRRVLINRLLGLKGTQAAQIELDELTYLLQSGSDRAGALDFQESPTNYVPRQRKNASLEELLQSAERVEDGIPLTPELDEALRHGTSLGGARPKALIDADDKKYIAKFSSRNDIYNVVKAEFIAMRLATASGLRVASVQLKKSLDKDVLLIERFDRYKVSDVWCRKAMVSALTLLALDEMMARYASYETLAEIIRHRFTNPRETLRELFGRMVFNILCGNIDDHARNHAAFWDGSALSLTPAYDICPQARIGQEASQAMLIKGDNRASHLVVCLESAPSFLLNKVDARSIIDHQIETVETNWQTTCDEAQLSQTERNLFWGRQFLNPFAFQGYSPHGSGSV